MLLFKLIYFLDYIVMTKNEYFQIITFPLSANNDIIRYMICKKETSCKYNLIFLSIFYQVRFWNLKHYYYKNY